MAAPGTNVLSTVVTGSYDLKSGTSMAAPHVAAEMALILTAHPEWDLNPVAACNP